MTFRSPGSPGRPGGNVRALRLTSPEQQGLERYRMALDPRRRLLFILGLSLIGLVSGITGAGSWRTWLLFANRTSFGVKDPQFHLDVSFFVFVYPFIRMVLTYLFVAVVLSALAAAAVHYLYGGLRLQSVDGRATVAARAHMFVLLGIFVLLKAVAYLFDKYGLDFSQRGTVTTGASYTDVNAVLPAKTILAVIAVLCAVLFFAGAARRSAMLPAVGFGLLVLSAILVGGLYPAIIQQFVVKPNELSKEAPYIQREIDNTRSAYGVSGAQVVPYLATTASSPQQLAADVTAVPDLRMADPAVLSQAFQQLQQVKGFYKFPGVLNMDRYQLPGSGLTPQDMVVAAREIAGPPASQANWINTHLVYTHGYGFVAASASTATSNGDPSFTESNIPPSGALGSFQPRVYFGEQEATYAIVGAPQGRAPIELDYPSQSSAEQQNTTYRGSGGVPIGTFGSRLLYAVKFHELNILLSGAINGQSRIIYNRDPLSRVAKVAPFLTLDSDPYPVVANGHILWVVDGYTTTNLYPYSERVGMQQATADTDTSGGAGNGQQGDINYVRNSVKAVVDAYDGSVTLYQWDTSDPMLRTWMKAFPGVIKPRGAIPSYLLPHLRYPHDLFDTQRQVLARYHVQQAQAFYGGQGFWDVPTDPTNTQGTTAQPPYYLTMSMPGQAAEFSLTTTFVQKSRPNMAAYLAVASDPQSPDYGTMRILQLPQDTAIAGPQQVQNTFESDPTASKELAQFRQGGSTVISGNLITLPLGGALLYVEPVYIQSTGGGGAGSYPTLQRVFASFGGKVGYSPTLQGALGQVFPGLAGQGAAGSGSPASGSGGSSGGGSLSATVLKYLAQAESDYSAAQAALKKGDLAGYGRDVAAMKTAVDNAQNATKGPASASGKATPTPSPSPSPSRSSP